MLIMAAGRGSRFGGYKQFEHVGGQSLLGISIRFFSGLPEAGEIIVVYPPGMDVA